jgi:hypothetical protein
LGRSSICTRCRTLGRVSRRAGGSLVLRGIAIGRLLGCDVRRGVKAARWWALWWRGTVVALLMGMLALWRSAIWLWRVLALLRGILRSAMR